MVLRRGTRWALPLQGHLPPGEADGATGDAAPLGGFAQPFPVMWMGWAPTLSRNAIYTFVIICSCVCI